MKIEQSQYPVVPSERVPQLKARSSFRQKGGEFSNRLGKIHTSKTTKKIHSLTKDPLFRQVSAEAVDRYDPSGKPLSDVSGISSEQIEKLWFRQKIEICPFIDIFV